MVVAAIVGILASVSIGIGSDTVRQARAREDRESTRALLIQARNHARRNTACVVVTRVSSTEVTAALSSAVGCPAAPHATEPTPARVVFTGGSTVGVFDIGGSPASTLMFFPDGSTRALAPVVMPFVRFDGKTSSLQIWPGAGLVTEEG